MSPYSDPQTAAELSAIALEEELMTPQLAVAWEGDRAPLAKAFVAAQKATEAVKKANSNPAFKSKYADLAAVVEAVVPALNAAGIGVLQFPAFDGEMVSVTTTLIHEGGSSVTGTLALRPSKYDPQGVGSATTYARRYSLLAMTGAAPEDDDGNAASGPVDASEAHRSSRKSAAQAKRDGDHETIIGAIKKCATEHELDAWYDDFARHTAHVPFSWLDPLRDEVEKQRNEILDNIAQRAA